MKYVEEVLQCVCVCYSLIQLIQLEKYQMTQYDPSACWGSETHSIMRHTLITFLLPLALIFLRFGDIDLRYEMFPVLVFS